MIVTFGSRVGMSVRCLLLMAAVTTSATGCGDDRPESLPSFSSTPSVQDTAAADKAAVEKAYRDYQKAFERLAAEGDVDPRTLLRHGTRSMAQRDVEAIAILADQDLRQVGRLGIDVRSVEVTGDKAVMEACLDQTRIVTVKKGEAPEPGQRGLGTGLARIDFVRQQNTWLYSGGEEAGPC
jgi:hypothetical protein